MSCSLLRKLKILQNENSISGDLIQKSFNDSYRALTTKVLEILRWYVDSSEKIPHLMKTDDDMYINLVRLYDLVKTNKKPNFLVGSLICNAIPIKDPYNKWYVPSYMFSAKKYPNYLSGKGLEILILEGSASMTSF